MSTIKGWVILHPKETKAQYAKRVGCALKHAFPQKAHVEVTYFHTRHWTSRKIPGRASREKWRKTFRPHCQIVRATLNF